MANLNEGLTLETLPKAFVRLTNEVSEIKRLLLENSNPQPSEPDHWFDLNELCDYLPDKPSKPTVYGWVSNRQIPHSKGGKKLRFLKSEIDSWLMQGKRKTIAETASDADKYLKKKGGNNG